MRKQNMVSDNAQTPLIQEVNLGSSRQFMAALDFSKGTITKKALEDNFVNAFGNLDLYDRKGNFGSIVVDTYTIEEGFVKAVYGNTSAILDAHPTRVEFYAGTEEGVSGLIEKYQSAA